jgi:hypothetical protein
VLIMAVKLIRDMTHLEVRAAEEKSRGRPWHLADHFALTSFSDGWTRSEVYWNDGAAVYVGHDTKAEAVEHLRSLGANVDKTGAAQ